MGLGGSDKRFGFAAQFHQTSEAPESLRGRRPGIAWMLTCKGGEAITRDPFAWCLKSMVEKHPANNVCFALRSGLHFWQS